MTEEVRAWWEATAEYFQEDIDLDVGVNWTGLGHRDLDLLDDVAGRDVLELGCGGGQCSVALAQRGADVIGVDLSRAQLAHAQELAIENDVSVPLVEGDITQLPVAADSFDVVFNAYVFQWVGDLPACFAEVARVLRPGGRFVFSMPHPYYEIVDPDTHEVAESYFDTGWQVQNYAEMDLDQVTYRHRVSDVFGALRGAGFRVDRLLEPGTDDPDDYEDGPWGEFTAELMATVPATVVFDARLA